MMNQVLTFIKHVAKIAVERNKNRFIPFYKRVRVNN